MTVLVADVGGTNTRLALGRDGGLIPGSIRRFENDAFERFADILSVYLAEGPAELRACCIAIAGPVTATNAQLTNRNWAFDPETLSAQLGGSPVLLVNDLLALGRALPHLGGQTLAPVWADGVGRQRNGQSLVVGVGTGFNACLTKSNGANPPVAIEAELGHSSVPHWLRSELTEVLGPAADRFATTEDCFSGRGLSAMDAALSGQEPRSSHSVLAASKSGKNLAATRAVDLLAGLLGRYVGELICLYLPFEGIYLAGGVARAVLQSQAREVFLTRATGEVHLSREFAQIPISVIAEDTAALIGCLVSLSEDPPFWQSA